MSSDRDPSLNADASASSEELTAVPEIPLRQRAAVTIQAARLEATRRTFERLGVAAAASAVSEAMQPHLRTLREYVDGLNGLQLDTVCADTIHVLLDRIFGIISAELQHAAQVAIRVQGQEGGTEAGIRSTKAQQLLEAASKCLGAGEVSVAVIKPFATLRKQVGTLVGTVIGGESFARLQDAVSALEAASKYPVEQISKIPDAVEAEPEPRAGD